ncbi:hypothetical protein AAHH80_35670, partial [Burkholderia pseudomallei]
LAHINHLDYQLTFQILHNQREPILQKNIQILDHRLDTPYATLIYTSQQPNHKSDQNERELAVIY